MPYRSLNFSLGWTMEEVLCCERLHKTPFQNEQSRGSCFPWHCFCFCDSWAIFTVSCHYLHQLLCATNSRRVFIDILVLRWSEFAPLNLELLLAASFKRAEICGSNELSGFFLFALKLAMWKGCSVFDFGTLHLQVPWVIKALTSQSEVGLI